MTRLLILLFLFALPVLAKKPPPPPQCSAFGWCDMGLVSGVSSNYTPVVSLNATQIRVYANTNGVVDGSLYLRVGSWSGVGSAQTVLDIQDARDSYIRTSGITRGESGTYYAVLYTGDGYPTQGGYSPSWATSPDGLMWTWHGPITLFGRNQSSAAALIVDESRTDAYACMAWLDLAGGLVMMHAPMPCDTAQWTSDGLNMWPIAGDGAPQFCSAAKTPYGVHIICAHNYPADAHRHIFSCDGLTNWHVLEMDSATRGTAQKGPNLVYEPSTNKLNDLTSGRHYDMDARSFPC